MTVRQPTLTIGVDPGTSVGIAALLDSERFQVCQFRVDRSGGRERLEATLNGLFDHAAEAEWRLLVGTERFVINHRTARLSQQTKALEVNGLVEALSPVPVELQSVASATAFASNVRLRRLGLWVRPADVDQPDADDANSAMRHALLLLARRRATIYEQLMDRATSA